MSIGHAKKQIQNRLELSLRDSPDLSSAKRAELQIKTIFKNTRIFELFCFLSVLLTNYLYYSSPQIKPELLLAWSIWVVLTSAVRITLAGSYRKENPPLQNSLIYRALLFSTFISGLNWGIACLYIQQPGALLIQSEFTTIVSGLCICMAAIYACSYRIFLAFSLPAVIPICLYSLLQQTTQEPSMVSIVIIFLIFLLFSAKKINSMFLGFYALQNKNQQLLDYINKEKLVAETLNKKLQKSFVELETKVDERTRELSLSNEDLQKSQERLNLAIDASKTGLWDWNLITDEMYQTKLDQLLGYSADEIPKFIDHLSTLVHRDDYHRVKRAMVQHFKLKSEYYLVRYRIKHSNGNWIWVEDRGQAIEWDHQGKVSRMIGTRRDVTDSRDSDTQLKLSTTVFENVSESIFVLNAKFCFITVNSFFTKTTGFSFQDILGKSVFQLDQATDIDRETYRDIFRALRKDKFWQGELVGIRKNGETYPQWLQINAIYDEDGSRFNYVGLFADLTEHRKSEQKLKYLENYDPITGLANRSLFNDRFHNAINRARRRNKNLALIFFDLDRFKQINDSYGHQTGDQLLKSVAERLSMIMPNADSISRVGSDEFTVVIESYEDSKEIEKYCTAFIESIKKPFFIKDQELSLGCSIGISEFPKHAKEMQILLNQADTAMYQSKRLGGNQYHFYSSKLQASSVEKLQLETQLRKALLEDQIIVYYQPKMTLATGRIESVEALVRWDHPSKGLLAPDKFVPLAEETGLISAVGEVVLDKACAQAKYWQQQNFGEISVSVNLSAQQIHKGNLFKIVKQTVTRFDLDPKLLELELTESLLMDDIKNTVYTLEAIRNMGVCISLDDFGTGYSSLSYLKKFPIDILKIDKSFVQEVDKNSDDAAITKAIIAMAHSLGLGVIAEGVETKEHLSFLKDEGCDCIQGYLISRPVDSEKIAAILAAQSLSQADLAEVLGN
ncbi:MAG: GGDEF domain-containing protein [Gammaproteobacteria bacterium]|nr:MAG: GGDEF domain-containing protein [Gammaproteobacteria bacterium]